MMKPIEIDRTDEEREELVKAWIKNNWLMVVLAVALAIAAVWGLNYYKQAKINALSDDAVTMQKVTQAIQDNQLQTAQQALSTLQTANPNDTFSALATLSLAQKYFNDKDYGNATKQYDWLIAHAGDLAMRDIARLRKARAQADNQQITEALNTLGSIEGKTAVAETNLLKGDLLLADKQYEAAKKAYESITADPTVTAEMIKQRLTLLTIKQQIQ